MTCKRRNRSASAMRFVAGVDDRPAPRRRRTDPFPDVLGALGDRIRRPPRRVQHLAGAGVDLAADEERDQHLGVMAEIVMAARQIVLMAAVTVAGRVGVVLEQIDRAPDRLLGETLLSRLHQALQDPLPRLVMDHQLIQAVALRRGVLRVRPHVEIQPGPVLQKHVGAAPPTHNTTEQVPGHLIRAQPALTAQGARHPVLVLEPVDPALHVANLSVPSTADVAVRSQLSFGIDPIGTRPNDRNGGYGALSFASSSAWCLATISSTAFMLRSANGSRPARARSLESSVAAAWPWNSGNTRWAISS